MIHLHLHHHHHHHYYCILLPTYLLLLSHAFCWALYFSFLAHAFSLFASSLMMTNVLLLGFWRRTWSTPWCLGIFCKSW
ncbi:hypothetical protein BKA80DRAFT_279066 [Phyllosticta citrichinensis]